MRLKLCALPMMVCWWAAASPALANEDRWKTAASGVWSVGSNWVDGSVPGNSDSAIFDVGGSYSVSFNADPLAVEYIAIESGVVTFTSNSFLLPSTLRTRRYFISATGSTVTLGSPGALFQPDKPLHLDVGTSVYAGGTLNVRFGSHVNASTVSAQGPGGTLNVTDGSRVISLNGDIGNTIVGGVANVLGSGSQWTISGRLTVGKGDSFIGLTSDGEGSLLISGGGLVDVADATVGEGLTSAIVGVGVVTVTGDGSVWNTTNELTVGKLGTGTVNIQPGGRVRVGGHTFLYPGGRVRLQGGTLETGELSFNGGGQMEWTSGKFTVGVFNGHLGNYGTGVLAPGFSGAGSTRITGNYQQTTGALEIEIGGAAQASQYDVVNVDGLALLDGQLDLKLLNSFMPSPSETFIIMTASSFSGAFANAANGQRVTTSDDGGSFVVNYGAGSAFDPTLMVLSDFRLGGVPGDFDDDGDVDRDDLLQWQGDFSDNDLSDADEDGDSDGADFLVWQRHLAGPAVPAAIIPEPASLTLLGLAAVGIAVLGRRGFSWRQVVQTFHRIEPGSEAARHRSASRLSGERSNRSKLCTCLATLPCVYAASFNAAAGASFKGMGGEESIAYAVSADGSTAVGADWTIFGHEAFQWTSGGSLQFQGDLTGGALGSIAYAANSDASVLVGIGASGTTGYEACRWTGTGIQPLGDLSGGSLDSAAYGVSGDGSIVAGYGTSSRGRQAIRHTMAGGMQGLGDFSGGPFESVAYGISSDGATIVGYGTRSQGKEAFLWTSPGGLQGLDDLSGGAFESIAYGVSGDGSVIVGAGTSASGKEAFRWTSASGMEGLGDLSGGSFSSVAAAISGDGLTVVGTGSTALGSEAFIWDATNGMRNLREVLTSDHGLNLEGWHLYEAKGVSADGRTIVGSGLNPNGGFEAWIAELEVSTPVLKGDFDDDGDVDRDDLLQWHWDFGQNGLSDADDDGDSDGADFLVWQRNLSGPTAPAATVPEPGGFALLGLAITSVMSFGRNRMGSSIHSDLLVPYCNA